jgi:GT2 family glycosyltransferase
MRVTVVIATRNRPAELARTLSHLAALRPAPPTIVVDNASDRCRLPVAVERQVRLLERAG